MPTKRASRQKKLLPNILIAALLILCVLTIFSFFAGMTNDQKGTLCIFLFSILRFPTHTLFWGYFTKASTTIYFLGLLFNDLLYAVLIERIYTCFLEKSI